MTTFVTSALPRIPDGVDRVLLHALPEGICRTFRVMPYQEHDGHVLVAATRGDDTITEHVVADRLDRPLLLVRHSADEIERLIDEAYPPTASQVETPAARRARMQMARMLTRSGLVTDEQLQAAMLEYARTGDPLGDILVAHGAISEDVHVAALSERFQMQRVGLTRFEPDYELARRLPEHLARRLQAIPVAEAGDTLLVAVTRPLADEHAAAVERALGQPFRQLLANRTDVDQLVQQVHGDHYTDVATRLLRDTDPASSAHVVTTLSQRAVLLVAAIVTVVCGVLWPEPTAIALVGACSALYLGVSLYRVRLTVHALGTRLETDVTDEELRALDERTLPRYTILVPLYREAELVERLVRDLDALDYPRTRLDVKLLCEEDDAATIDAIRALHLPPHYHLVVVPDALPKTKPKACNYGLQLATGAYCVIYDAEDRPDPDQLKKAVVAFRATDDDVVCIQAKLNHYNKDQNLLTSWFAGEYSMQFELVLPAMGDTDAPIPLGGTSNHFVTTTLRDLGAWDPYNVTEDADLGVRLHREGFRTSMIDSTTLEEANSAVGNWVRQRSRWIKGYLQTWLVHMRHPVRLLRQMGVRGFLAFNLTMGAAFVLLLNPIFWALTTLYAVTHWSAIEQIFPSSVYYASSLMLLVGNFVFIYLNVAGALQRGEFGLVRTALLSPLYWGLMSYAAWKGFLQLFTNPFYWEKTEHGLDTPCEDDTTVTVTDPTAATASGRVARDGDRRSAVQSGRRTPDIVRRRGESLAVFAVFAVTYSLVGYWLVVRLHVVGFESLDRLNRGLMVIHNEPAKLSAIGIDYAPLSTLATAPLAVVPAVASSLVAVPVLSAVFAAITMVVLNTLLRRADVSLPLRLLVLAGLGLNPLVVMHASLGTRSFLWLALVVAAVGALVAWYVTADIRFILVAGLCFGLASLTGYTSLVYAAVAAVAVAAVLARLGAGAREIEGTTIGFAAPAVYAVALWTALCLVLLGRPLAWVTDSSDTAASVGGLDRPPLAEVAADTGRLVLDGAPLAIAVLPLLLLLGLVRRNALALWLGVLLATAILVPGAAALLGLSDAPMAMSNALPVLVLAVVGAIWLVRSAVPRAPAALALGLALVASVPWTFTALPDFEHQGLERAFHDAVSTGDSQEGVRTVAGTVVGYDEEQMMGEWIREHVSVRDSVLTDNAQTYAVMLFSGRPDLFVDRVDRSDESWEQVAEDPAETVDYLLLSTDPTYDLLSQRYPDAAQGTDPGVREVFATDRYRLVAVTDGPTSPTRATESAPHDAPSALGSSR